MATEKVILTMIDVGKKWFKNGTRIITIRATNSDQLLTVPGPACIHSAIVMMFEVPFHENIIFQM